MTDILCSFFDMIGGLLNSLLPNLGGNSGASQISEAVEFFVKLIGAADYIFPVSTLFEVISIFIIYKTFMITLWIVNWVIEAVLAIIP